MAKTIYREEYRLVVSQLRDAREALALSQSELAVRLGHTQQWISQVESGSRRPDVIEFAELCLALGVDPRRYWRTSRRRWLNLEKPDADHSRQTRAPWHRETCDQVQNNASSNSIASNGSMRATSCSAKLPSTSQLAPSRRYASSVCSAGSTSHRYSTPASA